MLCLHHDLINQHFSLSDVWIEAYIPPIAVEAIWLAFGIKNSILEEVRAQLLTACIDDIHVFRLVGTQTLLL